MSSNIKVNKICDYCNKEFVARKTTTKTCSDNCAKRLYKAKQKETKIKAVETQTEIIKAKPIEDLKTREFLSVAEICQIFGVSRRTVYRMFERGEIKFGKAGARTIIKRSELDKLFL